MAGATLFLRTAANAKAKTKPETTCTLSFCLTLSGLDKNRKFVRFIICCENPDDSLLVQCRYGWFITDRFNGSRINGKSNEKSNKRNFIENHPIKT